MPDQDDRVDADLLGGGLGLIMHPAAGGMNMKTDLYARWPAVQEM